MTSNRPYLLRALYEWIGDNAMTPHLLVDATRDGVQVPASTVKDGRVVLNIAARAVATWTWAIDDVRFKARFGGVSQSVVVPVSAILAIYAQETGQGMMLPEDGGDPAGRDPMPPPSRRGRWPEAGRPPARGQVSRVQSGAVDRLDGARHRADQRFPAALPKHARCGRRGGRRRRRNIRSR